MGKIYTLCYSCNPRIGQIQNWEKKFLSKFKVKKLRDKCHVCERTVIDRIHFLEPPNTTQNLPWERKPKVLVLQVTVSCSNGFFF